MSAPSISEAGLSEFDSPSVERWGILALAGTELLFTP